MSFVPTVTDALDLFSDDLLMKDRFSLPNPYGNMMSREVYRSPYHHMVSPHVLIPFDTFSILHAVCL